MLSRNILFKYCVFYTTLRITSIESIYTNKIFNFIASQIINLINNSCVISIEVAQFY